MAVQDNAPILICYDDSPGARHAIEVAAALLPQRHAVVLDVASFVTLAETYATLGPVTPPLGEINRDDALSRAAIGADLARACGFTAEPRADVSSPTWGAVVEVADEIGAAAIVLGSRGLTGVKELLGGSFSHDVAEHAGRPVLIVPPARSRA